MLGRYLIVCILALGLCVPALAQTSTDNGLSASLEMFYFTDSEARDLLGTGMGLNVEKKLANDMYISLGYIKAGDELSAGSESLEWDVSLIPIMVTKHFGQISQNSNAYWGVGAGFVINKLDMSYKDTEYPGDNFDESDSSTDLAWQLVGGTLLGKNILAQAKYFSGGHEGNTGFSLNVGMKF